MSYGPKPWHQGSWDARAALNFIFGGAGAGLLLAGAFAGLPPEPLRLAMLVGLGLIGAGLVSVWFEIGRPLRALHVAFNPFTSWMSRESLVAGIVFALGLAAAWTQSAAIAQWTGLAALAFVYCQGRILQAAKGIPAWRQPALTGLIFTTGLAEGAGALVALAALFAPASNGVLGYFALALIAREFAWANYRSSLAKSAARPALAALERAGKILTQAGTLAPLALIVLAVLAPGIGRGAIVLAGAAALAAGWHWKFMLITRAAYNQGFALPHLPVRGSR